MRPIFFLTGFLFALNIQSPAYAYLDPGTGSMILQLALAGIAGSLVVIKVYWYKLKSLFSKQTATPESSVDDQD